MTYLHRSNPCDITLASTPRSTLTPSQFSVLSPRRLLRIVLALSMPLLRDNICTERCDFLRDLYVSIHSRTILTKKLVSAMSPRRSRSEWQVRRDTFDGGCLPSVFFGDFRDTTWPLQFIHWSICFDLWCRGILLRSSYLALQHTNLQTDLSPISRDLHPESFDLQTVS